MFDSLRKAFANATKSLSIKELKEKDIEDSLFELEIALLDSDVASEVIDSIKEELKKSLLSAKVERKDVNKFVRENLIRLISEMFDVAGTTDLLANIQAKKESPNPYIILFVGINGTGKTTTVAKIAHLLKNNKISVAVAASDTFRAGAIEQLKEHMNNLHLKIIAQNYGADPAAVAKDAVLYARSHKTDCILIDTAGRMQTSKNLMQQIAKITAVVKPDLTIFVGDALAGNDTVDQAREFHNHVKFDAAILTKSDADARGGAALSIVKVTSSPIIFVGVGQEYDDLIPFDKNVFLKAVFGSLDGVDLKTTHVDVKADREAETDESAGEHITEPTAQKADEKPEPALITSVPPSKESDRQSEPKTVEQVEPSGDPFEGIETEDIVAYSDLYNMSPPEDDQQARLLAGRIREWVSDGRPTSESTKKSGEKPEEVKIEAKEEIKEEAIEPKIEEKPEEVKIEEKPEEVKIEADSKDKKPKGKEKKKRGLFGRFRR